MRKLLRYSSAAAVTGLVAAGTASQLSKKSWDLRDRETRVICAAGALITALLWTATLA